MKKIEFDYDKDVDVMYIVFSKPKDAIAEEISRNVFVRFEPKTKKVVGVTIIGFSKFLKKETALKIPVSL